MAGLRHSLRRGTSLSTSLTSLGVRARNQGGGGQQQQLAFGSSRLRVPDRTAQLNVASSFKGAINTLSAGSAPFDITNIRVFLPGFACNNGGATPSEQQIPATFQAGYSLEVGGVRYPATFGGQQLATLGGPGSTNGRATLFDCGKWSDIIMNGANPLTVTANSNIRHVALLSMAAVGDLFPASQYLATLVGDQCKNAADPTTLLSLLASGAITSSGSAPTKQFCPMFMVGERTDGNRSPVILIHSDSIGYGVGDFTTGIPASEPRGAIGWMERGLDDPTNGRIMSGHIGLPGSFSTQNTNGVFGSVDYTPGIVHRVTPLLELKSLYGGRLPFTCIFDQHGNNGDANSGSMTMSALYQGVSVLKGYFPGIRYVKATLPARIGTGGDYRDPTLQTPGVNDVYPAASYQNGYRQYYNDQIMADAGVHFDAVFDVGYYGTAAYQPNYHSGDPNYNQYRSAAPVFDSVTLAGSGYASSATTFQLNEDIPLGALLSFDGVRANILGPVVSKSGSGPYTYNIQSGSGKAVTYAASTAGKAVGNNDGTHPGPQMAKQIALGVIAMKQASMFGTG
ncbi:hypothetical protein [Rhizobium sp. 768_B6_N1_8]|uniref:hypothetical protein n=1 Tax=unclassified Rhizobium TaxID=2613769 RepID=UPI003F1F8F17